MYVYMNKVWMDIQQGVNIGYLGREGENGSCLTYMSLYCFTCFNIYIFCNLKNKIKGENASKCIKHCECLFSDKMAPWSGLLPFL